MSNEDLKLGIGIEVDSKSIETLVKTIESKVATIDVNLDLSNKWLKKIQNKLETIKFSPTADTKKAEASIDRFKDNLKYKLENLKPKITVDDKGASASFNKIEKEINELSKETVNASQKMRDLQREFSNLSDIANRGKPVGIKVEADINLKELEKTLSSIGHGDVTIKNLNDTVLKGGNAWRTFTANATNADGTIKQLKGSINIATGDVRVLENELQKTAKATSTLGETIIGLAASYLSLNTVIRIFSQIKTSVLELDNAMTDIQIVTEQTNKSVAETINEYNKLAIALGVTTKAVAEGSIEWLRQGKTVEETNELIKTSTMFAKIAQMGTAESTELLTAALNGYKLEAKDAMGVVDMFNAVDLIAATSAKELGTAYQYVASSASAAGISQEKLTALLAVGSETTRLSAETIGQAWKTLTTRITNIKVGKFVDEDTGEALNDVEKVLGKLDIKLRENETTWRNMGDIIDDVGTRWSEFTDIEKSAISTAMAGTRQANIFRATMEGYGDVLEYTTVAQNSAGVTARKYAEVIDSLDYKINAIVESSVGMWNNLVDNDVVKFFLDVSKVVIDGLNAFDGLPVKILITVAALSTFNAVSKALIGTKYAQFFGDFVSGFSNVGVFVKNLTDQIVSLAIAQTGYTTTTFSAAAAQLGFAGTVKVVTSALLAQAAIWATTPMGMATLAVAGIYTLVKATDYFTVSLEEQKQKLEDISSAYKQTTSDLIATENELKTIGEQIDEINSKDTPTLTDLADLERLQQQNSELENRIALLKLEKETLNDEQNVEAIKTAKSFISENLDQQQFGTVNPTFVESDYDKALAAYNNLIERQEELNIKKNVSKDITKEELEELVELPDKITLAKKPLSEIANGAQDIIDKITGSDKESVRLKNTLSDIVDTVLGLGKREFALKIDNLEKIINKKQFADIKKEIEELGNVGALTADKLNGYRYGSLINQLQEVGVTVQDVIDIYQKIPDAIEDITDTAEGIESFGDSLKSLSDKMSFLTSAQKEMDENGQISLSTLEKLMSLEEDYASYIDTSSGSIKFNTAAYKDNIKEKTRSRVTEKENLLAIAKSTKATLDMTAVKRSLTKAEKEQYDAIVKEINNLEQEVSLQEAVANAIDETDEAIQQIVKNYKEFNSELDSNRDKLKKAQDELVINGKLSLESMDFIMDKYPELFGLINDAGALQAALRDKEVQLNKDRAKSAVDMLEEKKKAVEKSNNEIVKSNEEFNKDLNKGYLQNTDNYKNSLPPMIEETKSVLATLRGFWEEYWNNLIPDNLKMPNVMGSGSNSSYNYTGVRNDGSLNSTGFRSPLDSYRISSAFSDRINPITGKQEFHNGVDMAAPSGTPVYAAAGGTVKTASYDDKNGNYIVIDHENGTSTLYLHNSSLKVEGGQPVNQGQKIAEVGSTGQSTGPHLHFMVKVNGKAVDPEQYLTGGKSLALNLDAGVDNNTSNKATSVQNPYSDLINKYSNSKNIDPNFLAAVIMGESGFKANAVGYNTSKSGKKSTDVGLMQLNSSGAGYSLAQSVGSTGHYVASGDPRFDPETSIKLGADYLAQKLVIAMKAGLTGTDAMREAYAMYNSGAVRIGASPSESYTNADRIMNHYKEFSGGASYSSNASNSNSAVYDAYYNAAQQQTEADELQRQLDAADKKLKDLREAKETEIKELDNWALKQKINSLDGELSIADQQEYNKRSAAINEKYQSDEENYLKTKLELIKSNNEIYLDLFNKEKKALDDKLAAGLVSEEDYYDQLRKLSESYFKDKEQYLDEYNKYEIESVKALQRIQEKQLENDLSYAEYTDDYDKQLEIYRQFQDNAHVLANKYREAGLKETDVEITELQKKWRGFADKIQEINLIKINVDYSKFVEGNNKALASLDYQLNLLSDNDYDVKVDLTNRKLELQKVAVEKAKEQFNKLAAELDSGNITIAQFRSETDSLSQTIQDGTIQAKQYADAIREISLAKAQSQRSDGMALIDMTRQLIQQQVKDEVAAEQAKKDAIDATLKAQKDSFDARKKSIDENAKAQDKAHKQRLKDIDNELSAQKKLFDTVKKALEDQKKQYKGIIDTRIKALQNESDNYDYNNEVTERQSEIAKLESQIDNISYDTSNAGVAKRLQLEEELAEKRKEFTDFQYKHDKNAQIDALNAEYDRFEAEKQKELDLLQNNHDALLDRLQAEKETQQANYDARKEQIDAEKQAIDDLYDSISKEAEAQKAQIDADIKSLNESIANSGDLTIMAMKMIDEEGDALYARLIEWNKKYGSGISQDVMSVWDDGKAYLNNFETSLQAIESVSQRIVNLMREMSALQSSQIGVRTYLENLNRDVGYNESTGNIIVDGKEYGNTKNVFTNVNGSYQGTADDIEKLLRELGLPSYDVGSWKVPEDKLSMVHKDELIVPADEAPAARALLQKFSDLSPDEQNAVMGREFGTKFNSNVSIPDVGPVSQMMANATQAGIDKVGNIQNNTAVGDFNVEIKVEGNADKKTVALIKQEMKSVKDDVFTTLKKQYHFSSHKKSLGSMR